MKDFSIEDRKVTFVVNAFRQGRNTMEIAAAMHLKEEIVERMLHAGLAVERMRLIKEGKQCH